MTKMFDVLDFGQRWNRCHPIDDHLPPFLGGPIDELFLGQPVTEKRPKGWSPSIAIEQLHGPSKELDSGITGQHLSYRDKDTFCTMRKLWRGAFVDGQKLA